MEFFFFQAEDGIRDRSVTGVQTCALPISLYIYLHPTMDVYGRKDTAFIVDLSYADKMIREPLRADNIDVSEYRGDKKRVIETFAPVFKYPKSHAIFKLTA